MVRIKMWLSSERKKTNLSVISKTSLHISQQFSKVLGLRVCKSPLSDASSCLPCSLDERDVTGNFQWGRKSTLGPTERLGVTCSTPPTPIYSFIPSD